MGIEWIVGGFFAALGAIFAAFKIGGHKGRTEADTANRVNRAEEDAKRVVDSNSKAADRQVTVATESAKVNNEVSGLNDGDAVSELRRDYSRD